MTSLKFLLVFILLVSGWVGAEMPPDSGVAQSETQAARNQDAPKSWRRIFIIRHGQRPNEMDPRLTVLGRKQAELVAQRLKADGFDGEFYASPYKRTVETAVPAARLFGKKIRLCPAFQEITYTAGVPNTPGLTQKQLQEMFPGFVDDNPKLDYPWVMTGNYGQGLEKNVAGGIARILKDTKGDVAIFTHGGQVETAVKILTKTTKDRCNFTAWNCVMCTFLVKADGTVVFIGITSDFMLPDEISNNEGDGILGRKVPCVMPDKE